MKLTKDSAKLLEKYGKVGAIQPGVVQKSNGQIIKWLRFENPSQLFSPAMATGVAGMMTQMALEQAIQEITDYLKSIEREGRRPPSRPEGPDRGRPHRGGL